jgi:hypothetical protein
MAESGDLGGTQAIAMFAELLFAELEYLFAFSAGTRHAALHIRAIAPLSRRFKSSLVRARPPLRSKGKEAPQGPLRWAHGPGLPAAALKNTKGYLRKQLRRLRKQKRERPG